jgi:hypothetical protein
MGSVIVNWATPLISTGFAILGGQLAGPVGGAIGWGLGMGVGGALFPPEAEKTAAQSMGPQQLFIPTADYGGVVTVLRGCRRVGGNLIWYDQPRLITDPAQVLDWANYLAAIIIVAGGTEPDTKYATNFAYGVCHGYASTFKVYEGKKEYLLYRGGGYLLNEGENVPPEYIGKTYNEQVQLAIGKGLKPAFKYVQYYGDQNIADPTIVTAKGVDNVPPYRNLHYIVFKDFPELTEAIPQLSFETGQLDCSGAEMNAPIMHSYGDGFTRSGIFPAIKMYKNGLPNAAYIAVNFNTDIPGITSRKVDLVNGNLAQTVGSVTLSDLIANNNNNTITFSDDEESYDLSGDGVIDPEFPTWWLDAIQNANYAFYTGVQQQGSFVTCHVTVDSVETGVDLVWVFFNHYRQNHPDETWVGVSGDNAETTATANTSLTTSNDNVLILNRVTPIRSWGTPFSEDTVSVDTVQGITAPAVFTGDKTTTVSGNYPYIMGSDYWNTTGHYIASIYNIDYTGTYEESSNEGIFLGHMGGPIPPADHVGMPYPCPVSLSIATDVGDFDVLLSADEDDYIWQGYDPQVWKIDASTNGYTYTIYSHSLSTIVYGWITPAGQHHRLVFDNFDDNEWSHPFITATYIAPDNSETTVNFGSAFDGYYGTAEFLAGSYTS